MTFRSPELDRTELPSIRSGDVSESVSKTAINSAYNRSALRSGTSLGPSSESLKSGGSGKSPVKKSSKAKVLDLDRPLMPLMSKQDVARYRNSISQNVCQDMLMKVTVHRILSLCAMNFKCIIMATSSPRPLPKLPTYYYHQLAYAFTYK